MFRLFRPFAARAYHPIGVDFGTQTLRLAQCVVEKRGWHLHAAAHGECAALADDSIATADFLRDLLHRQMFHGKEAVLTLPADQVAMRSLRPGSHRSELEIELAHELQLPRSEIVCRTQPLAQGHMLLIATPRGAAERLVQIAERSRLQVVGLNIAPKAVVDCFSQVYRRKSDAEQTHVFVEIGCRSTRLMICRHGQLQDVLSIAVAGDDLNRTTAAHFDVSFETARLMRMQIAKFGDTLSKSPQLIAPTIENDRRQSDEPVHIVGERLPESMHEQFDQVNQATEPVIQRLGLAMGQSLTPVPADRLIFVGGEARQTRLCQKIAEIVRIPAQIGDPFVRVRSTLSPESGIDVQVPQPNWSVAVGLSMGPRQSLQKMAS